MQGISYANDGITEETVEDCEVNKRLVIEPPYKAGGTK